MPSANNPGAAEQSLRAQRGAEPYRVLRCLDNHLEVGLLTGYCWCLACEVAIPDRWALPWDADKVAFVARQI